MKQCINITRIEIRMKLFAIIVFVSLISTRAYTLTQETTSNESKTQKSIEKATDATFLFDKTIKVKANKVDIIEDGIPSELPIVKNPEKELSKWEIYYRWDYDLGPHIKNEGVTVWLCSPQWITARSFILAKQQMKTTSQANEEWKKSITGLWDKNITFGAHLFIRESRDLQQMKNIIWHAFLLTEDGKYIPAKSVVIDFENLLQYPGTYHSATYIAQYRLYLPSYYEVGYYSIPCAFVFDRTDDKGAPLLNPKTKSISLGLGSELCQVRFEWQFKK